MNQQNVELQSVNVTHEILDQLVGEGEDYNSDFETFYDNGRLPCWRGKPEETKEERQTLFENIQLERIA